MSLHSHLKIQHCYSCVDLLSCRWLSFSRLWIPSQVSKDFLSLNFNFFFYLLASIKSIALKLGLNFTNIAYEYAPFFPRRDIVKRDKTV